MASILLTAGILLGFVFLFVFLFSQMHKRGKKKLLVSQNTVFNKLVSINNLTITEKEEFAHYHIALDTSNLKLLYVNFSNTKEDVTILDLQKVKSVKVNMEENSIYENRKGKTVLIEKEIVTIKLILTINDTVYPTTVLTFYRYEDGKTDYAVLKTRMEYWKQKITDYIGV